MITRCFTQHSVAFKIWDVITEPNILNSMWQKMERIRRLKNPVQKYAWGSPTAIPRLLGQDNPDNEPWAELWIGAHPKAPSLAATEKGWESLQTVIQKDPVGMLGQRVSRQFGGRLPFLFKVLAAAAPLSIQAHPNKIQAEKGFAEENRLGIPMDAPNRNYRDDNHKPECICAVEPFLALCGFRRVPDILAYMEPLRIEELAAPLSILRQHPNRNGLGGFYQALMTLSPGVRRRLVSKAVEGSEKLAGEDPAYGWVIRLDAAYPEDIGALSPLMLNLVRLEPGQALFLPAGELHAYLEGVGIELMANSDNVLRGGLTPKHVDASELMSVLNFEQRDIRILSPRIVSAVENVYPTPAGEFQLSVIHLSAKDGESTFKSEGLQILLCVEGGATFTSPGQEGELKVEKGEAMLVPADVDAYRIRGHADFYKASIPRNADDPDGAGLPLEPS